MVAHASLLAPDRRARDDLAMAVDPSKTVQQHDPVEVSELLAQTSKFSASISGLDMIGANTDFGHHQYFGDPGTLDKVGIVLDGSLSADATVTIEINGTPVEPSSGVVTVAAAGSGAGVSTTYTPTSANELADGDVISCTVGGANATATFSDVSMLISYVAVGS
jgi:hypothetical protein